MKTNVQLLNHKQCEKTFASSFWSWLQLSLSQFTHAVKKSYSLIVRVRREVHAGLLALARSSSNNRTYLGLVLMLVAAPLSGAAYQLFDRSAHIAGWYHVNLYYFFFLLGPHIMMLLVITGIFLIMPANKRAFFLSVPAGDQVARIVWLSLANSNDDFYRIVPSYFFFIGILIAAIWLITFDWLMSLHFHKRADSQARINGIIDAPGISDSDKIRIAQAELKVLKSLK
jgi:hypothetical protein